MLGGRIGADQPSDPPSQVGAPEKQADYTSAGSGFWMAAEASAAYSCRLFNSNFGYTEN